MKYILLFTILLISLNAKEILVSKKDIKYHEILESSNLILIDSNKKVRCTIFDKKNLIKKNYQSKRYIIKGYPICTKDVQIIIKNKIRYDFGNIIIEKDGKVIGETKKYIKIKNTNGSIDKIFKNGQIK